MLGGLSSRSVHIAGIGLLAAAAVLVTLILPAAAQGPPSDPPARPQGLTGDDSHDSVSLHWGDTGDTGDPDDPGITGYRALRRNREADPSGVFSVRIDDTGSAGNSQFNEAAPSASAEESTSQPPPDGTRPVRPVPNVEESYVNGGGICDRTEAVRVGLVDLIDDLHPSVASCADVTDAHLAAITGSLDLRRSGIGSLKAGDFADLTHLETLKLSRNRLRTLPAGIFAGLVNLKDLDLWFNELETLPSGVFSGLTSLQDLDLEENELRLLPAGVFDGLSLTFLGLEGNRLRTLPPGLFAHVDVSLTLDLSHNELRALPGDVFSGLTDLSLLDLSANQLRVLPAGVFSGLTGLRTLWVDQNPGAPFTFTMMAKRIPGTNKLVVTVAEGAPFPMTTTISVIGGTPPASMFPVTVAAGRTSSDEIAMTSLGGARAAMGTAPSVPESDARSSFYGIETAVGGPVALYDISAGAVAITSNPGPDETYAAGDAIEVTVTFAESMTVDTTDGTPQIGLTIGTMPKLAGYANGSGTAALVFSYTVAEGDLDPDGVSTGAGSIPGHKVDGVRPLLLSAMVDDAVITLNYSKALRESPSPPASAFAVEGGSAARTATNVAVTGSVVELTLNSVVEHGEAGLTVSYTVPEGTNADVIRDLVGNDADGLSSEPVWGAAPDRTDPVANEPPAFDAGETVERTISENTVSRPYQTGLPIGARVAATDPDASDTLAYFLSGPDATSFDIVASTGQLLTNAILDYEIKASYTIIVSVHDGKDAEGNFSEAIDDAITITIILYNEDDLGTVAFSSAQPRVGAALTATPTDPDGSVSNLTWQWAGSPDRSSNWATISGAASPTYTPVSGDAGNYLRAMASYTDGHGSGKSAYAVSANPVEEALPPPPPPPPTRPLPASTQTPPVRETTTTTGGGGFAPVPPPRPAAPPRPVVNIQTVEELFRPLSANGSLVRIWRFWNRWQRWEFHDPDPPFAVFNTLKRVNLAADPPEILIVKVDSNQRFRGYTLHRGWNYIPMEDGPPARVGSKVQPIGQLFSPLVDNRTLGRVWWLNSLTQEWKFFDSNPELAPFNTLEAVNLAASPPVVVIVSVSRGQTFRGQSLYRGLSYILLR